MAKKKIKKTKKVNKTQKWQVRDKKRDKIMNDMFKSKSLLTKEEREFLLKCINQAIYSIKTERIFSSFEETRLLLLLISYGDLWDKLGIRVHRNCFFSKK